MYRESLLPLSETFIINQGESLTQYSAQYVGLHRILALLMPEARTHVLDMNGSVYGTGSMFRFFGRIPVASRDQLTALRPALVHVHFGTNAADGMWLAKALGIPLIVTFHGYDATVNGLDSLRTSDWLAMHLWRRRIGNTSFRILAVSDFIATRLRATGFPAEKIVRHYIGAAPARVSGLPLQQRRSTVLFVGRLVEKKGVAHLLRAMSIVQTVRPDAELIVIGDGLLRSLLESEAANLRLKVRFLGAQPNGAVLEWMSCARVFCLPSVRAVNGDSEGLGMVALESMSCGTPVAGFRHGGIPEVVVDGETGLLCAEADHAGLAQNILTLLDKEDLWCRMSIAGQERVRRHFDLARQTAQLEDIYQHAIETYSRRRT